MERRALGLPGLKRLVWQHRVQLFVILVLSAGLAGLTAAYGALVGPLLKVLFGGSEVAWPAALEPYIPAALTSSELRSLMPWLIISVALLKGVCQYLFSIQGVSLAEAVSHRLRVHLHRSALGWTPDQHQRVGASELLSRSMYDVESISAFLRDGIAGWTRSGLELLALLGLCFAIDWKMALVVFLVYPVAFLPVVRIGRALRRAAVQMQSGHASLLDELDDHCRRTAIYQTVGHRGLAETRYTEESHRFRTLALRAEKIKSLASPLMEVFGAVALALGVWYVIVRIDEAALAPELLMSFLAALLLIYRPVKALSRAHVVLEPARAAHLRLDELLSNAELLSRGGALVPPKTLHGLVLEELTVSRGGREVLREVSAVFERGRLGVITGDNGTGKTTLAMTVATLLPLSKGRILLDGQDLSQFDHRLWRDQIGWVGQEQLLGRGTVRDNVTLGRSVSELVLARAARDVGLDAVVAKMPEGWATLLDESGGGLSGGEKQRLALCRALLLEPQVLVLDEPLAHLDSRARAQLLPIIESLCVDRIVIIISHDPDLITSADEECRLRSTPAIQPVSA